MTLDTLAPALGGIAPEPGAAVPEPRFTPGELAAVMGEKNRPTDEQSAIIASPLSPRLVIAGAGSGKTATMADRVVWLVANGWVRPEEVLGVTFTRKAAGELASRIRAKLATLQRIAAADPGRHRFPDWLAGSDELEPKVSTYHSYASGIVSDYGLRLGIERDVVLLGGAQAWQLASEVVEGYDGPYEHFTAAKSTLVNAVVQLAGECAEHLREPAEVQSWLTERAAEFSQLPYQAGAKKNPTQAASELNAMLLTRASVADMVGRYQAAKRERGVLDFGDLVALAARIARDVPVAAATERSRYKVVLLDEFQDTSHAQLVLFSRLFGEGHAVTAVGDPNQSIYGFRGASAGQLFHFVQEFPARNDDGDRPASFVPAPVSYLTTAWRNGRNILGAANVISAPLNKSASSGGPAGERTQGSAVSVPPLRPSPAAVEGNVVLGRFATDEDEAAAVARDVMRYRRTIFETDPAGEAVLPSMAVLCRRRAQMEVLRREFELQGIPYEIVGLGGLLDTPEIVDLVSTLRVLADPGRSDALMRLLAGARWRIGTADLMAFHDWSRFLARRRAHGSPGPEALMADLAADEGAADVLVEGDITDAASLVEALDFLPRPGWTSAHGRSLTPAAQERLGRLSAELRMLRSFLGDDLTTLLGEVERAMLLDVEVAAKPGISIHQARRNLDAFQDAAAGFLQTSQRVDLLAFLSWLEAAASEEGGLDAAATEVNHEAVQLLTVHASKGLEWDVVFVPGLNAGAFPSSRDSRWSSGAAALPWPLRGDRADLPQWDLDQPDQKGWLDAEKVFKAEVQHHGEAEERRLAYVAYTRAKFVLWLSSAAWNGSRSGIAEISPFLSELAPLTEAPGLTQAPGLADGLMDAADLPDRPDAGAAAGIHAGSLREDELPAESPLTVAAELAIFPYDPLEGPCDPRTGERLRNVPGRRAAMDAAADRVRRAIDGLRPGDPLCLPEDPAGPGGAAPLRGAVLYGAAAGWAAEADLLLKRSRQRKPVQDIHLPGHISASMFVELGDDPDAVLAQLRRPVPREPGVAARKGTAFHAWVEEYFGTSGMLDLGEESGADAHIDAAYGLDDMVDTFKNSEWAHRAPAFVEVPVETSIAGVVVRGRIDAVFRNADGSWELVDWKTGRRPSGGRLASRSVQLAVYRLAWARLKGVPLETVSAAFYYVPDDAVVRPHDLGSAAELEAIIADALSRPGE